MFDPAVLGTAMIGIDAVRARERAELRGDGEQAMGRAARRSRAPGRSRRRALAVMLLRVAEVLDPAVSRDAAASGRRGAEAFHAR